MKWLKPEFITFAVGAVVVILNDRFGWGLTPEGVIAFFVTVGGYLLQQGIVNIKRGQPLSFKGLSVNSRKLIFTLVGALFIGLNEAMQLGFSQDVVWVVAGIITGYNAIEGTKDVQEAKQPPMEVHLPSHKNIGFYVPANIPEDPAADDQSH